MRHTKSVLRQNARSRRDALDPLFRQQAASRVTAALLARLRGPWRCVRHMGVYMAQYSELDLSALFAPCWQQGIKTYIPKMASCDEKAAMVFAPLEDMAQLQPHPRLGFRQTQTAPVDWAQLQLICVPGLAFDGQGHRLGYGHGFFDRALPKTQAFRLGIGYQAQWVPEIPAEGHDERMDGFLSEAGMKMYATCCRTIDVSQDLG